jgi:hypothetical protein
MLPLWPSFPLLHFVLVLLGGFSTSECCWNGGGDCDEFFFEQCYIVVRWLAVDFSGRFLLNFLSDICP